MCYVQVCTNSPIITSTSIIESISQTLGCTSIQPKIHETDSTDSIDLTGITAELPKPLTVGKQLTLLLFMFTVLFMSVEVSSDTVLASDSRIRLNSLPKSIHPLRVLLFASTYSKNFLLLLLRVEIVKVLRSTLSLDFGSVRVVSRASFSLVCMSYSVTV